MERVERPSEVASAEADEERASRAEPGPAVSVVSPASAALWGFGAVALGKALHVMVGGPPTTGAALAHLLYAAFHPLFLGVMLAAALALGASLLAGRRRWIRALAAVVASTAAAALVVPGELTRFAERMAPGHEPWAIGAGTFAFALLAPAAWLAGAPLRRRRLRWAGPVAALAAAVTEPYVLPGLYPGLHVYGLWLAGVFGASAMRGGPAKPRRTPARRAAQVAVVMGALGSVLWPAPMAVRGALARDGGFLLPLLPWPAPQVARVERTHWLRPVAQRSAAPPSDVPRPVEHPIVILITVDSLREDVLWRRDTRGELPTLVSLAERGVYFANAHAPGSMTVNTLSSMFSGTLYSQQRWTRADGGGALWPYDDRHVHFPQLLTEAGVRTINIPGTNWLIDERGILRGFEIEEYRRPSRPAEGNDRWNHSEDIVGRMIEELDELGSEQPAFLYGHIMDPHGPYIMGGRRETHFLSYVAELARVDRWLARLRRHLRRTGLADRTYLFISSDHGEGFGEHGGREHAYGLYEELIHVPLIVTGPGLSARRVEELVSLTDLGPTILDIFGQPTPAQFVGQSLLPLMLGRPAELTRPVLAETRLMRSLVTADGVKVIRDLRRGTLEVYDLRADPGEERDLVGEMTPEMERAVAVMDTFFEVHQLREGGYEPPLRN